MKRYLVNFEYRPMWNLIDDINRDSYWIVSDADIDNLAFDWNKPVEELMHQVTEIREDQVCVSGKVYNFNIVRYAMEDEICDEIEEDLAYTDLQDFVDDYCMRYYEKYEEYFMV